jgi:hypothetical protein
VQSAKFTIAGNPGRIKLNDREPASTAARDFAWRIRLRRLARPPVRRFKLTLRVKTDAKTARTCRLINGLQRCVIAGMVADNVFCQTVLTVASRNFPADSGRKEDNRISLSVGCEARASYLINVPCMTASNVTR